MNYPTHLTTEELERWAYANGDAPTASLAAKRLNHLEEQIVELEYQLEDRDTTISDLESQLSDALENAA
jgi:predicted RNase H-like nuclease (RuvC/YqgF family)